MCSCRELSGGGKHSAKQTGKQARTWDLNGGGGKSSSAKLDFSSEANGADVNGGTNGFADSAPYAEDVAYRPLIGRMAGELRDLDVPEEAPDTGAGDEPDGNEQVSAAGADQKSQSKCD